MKSVLLVIVGAIAMNAQSPFEALVDRYFEDQFRLHPSRATDFGFHEPYDSQFEDYSVKSNQEQVAMDEKYLAEFQRVPASDERDLVISNIRADLLDIQNIRGRERNPDHYSSGVTESIFKLISRKFAPPEERLRDVIAREEKIPQVFVEARQNLKNPPRIYTEVALEQLPGIESFFSSDVPAAFTEVKD
jgi:hypothetical protein